MELREHGSVEGDAAAGSPLPDKSCGSGPVGGRSVKPEAREKEIWHVTGSYQTFL